MWKSPKIWLLFEVLVKILHISTILSVKNIETLSSVQVDFAPTPDPHAATPLRSRKSSQTCQLMAPRNDLISYAYTECIETQTEADQAEEMGMSSREMVGALRGVCRSVDANTCAQRALLEHLQVLSVRLSELQLHATPGSTTRTPPGAPGWSTHPWIF